jgi:HD-GYP domain-containing protein (c-di-GMP phosphodiesterase class II)
MRMRLERPRWLDGLLGLASTLVLAFCLFYAYAGTILIPYSGINYDGEWRITSLDACEPQSEWCQANQGLLQTGDQIRDVAGITLEAQDRNQLLVAFDGLEPGDSARITFSRNGATQAVDWHMPSSTPAVVFGRLSVLLIFLPFWLAGTVILLFLRPRDLRWRLLIAFNYVTAMWWVVGAQSSYRVAASSLLLGTTTWLLVPIYLHLHLTIPAPLLRLPRYLIPSLYAVAGLLAVLELLQVLPSAAYSLGLLLAVLGSLGMLLFHLLDKSSQAARLATRLMLAGIGLALGPGIVLWVIPTLLNATAPEGLTSVIAIFAVPILPWFYSYAIYKRHLGSLEFRANRLLGLYSFTLLYVTMYALILVVGTRWIAVSTNYVVFTLATGALFVVAAPSLRQNFQRWVDRLAYGAAYNPDEIIRVFANRIPIASDRQALVRLLADELVPSLLIRQSALYLLLEAEPHLVYVRNVNLVEVPGTAEQARRLLSQSGQYQPPQPEEPVTAGDPAPPSLHLDAALTTVAEGVVNGEAFNWVRLAVPLKVQDKTIGMWLFGRRDPDDFYPQHDIALLGALANQVALAVQNAQLFEEANRRLQRLEALRHIDLAITSSLDLRLTLNVFLDQVTTLLGIHAASILLYNPQLRLLEYAGQRGFRTGALRHTHLRLGEGFAGRAALDRTSVSVANLSESAGDLVRAKLLPQEGFISYHAVPLLAKGEVKGVLEIFHRAPLAPNSEWLGFVDSLAAQAAIAIDNAALFDGLQRSNAELALAYDTTLEGWSRALELRDQETEGHTQRVTEMTLRLAQRTGVSEAEMVHIRRGALLHDIGKMAIPDAILLKPGPLTAEEWVIMRRHPTYAYEMLSPISYLRPALDIPYCHHEKWDGTGYPRGLSEEHIPRAARIFAVADVWDALTTDRPYRPAWSESRAYDYIREQAGKHFDLYIANTFMEMIQAPR